MKFKQFMEMAKNYRGETEYTSFSAWRKALRSAWPNVAIEGDRDIANASVDGKHVGEWDGGVGSINNDAHKRVVGLNQQPRDLQGFSQSIINDPFDSTLRLIFADWLEETGKSVESAILRSDKPIFSIDNTPLTWEQLLQVKNLYTSKILVNNTPLSKYKIINALIMMIADKK